VGTRAPDFDFPLVSEGTFSSQNLKGHPVVVNFWASWCLPCREEAPLLEEKWNAYRGRGIRFLGVNVKDSLEDARAFTKEFGLTFPSVRDTDLYLYTSFGLVGLPETFFIDHTYKFRGIGASDQSGEQAGFKILGAIPPAVLDSQIQLLLKLKEND
jgi:cytochrome c biogenesis protein CcmG/thiol:disulfide interchange protein DsbE